MSLRNLFLCCGTSSVLPATARDGACKDTPALLWVKCDGSLEIVAGGASEATFELFAQDVDGLSLADLVEEGHRSLLCDAVTEALGTGFSRVLSDVSLRRLNPQAAKSQCNLCLLHFQQEASSPYLLVAVGTCLPAGVSTQSAKAPRASHSSAPKRETTPLPLHLLNAVLPQSAEEAQPPRSRARPCNEASPLHQTGATSQEAQSPLDRGRLHEAPTLQEPNSCLEDTSLPVMEMVRVGSENLVGREISGVSAVAEESQQIPPRAAHGGSADSLVYSISQEDVFPGWPSADLPFCPAKSEKTFVSAEVQTSIVWTKKDFICQNCARPPLPKPSCDKARAMAALSKLPPRKRKAQTDDVWTLLAEKEAAAPESLFRLHISGARFVDNHGDTGSVRRKGRQVFIEDCSVIFEGDNLMHIDNPGGERLTFTRGDGGRGLGHPLVRRSANGSPRNAGCLTAADLDNLPVSLRRSEAHSANLMSTLMDLDGEIEDEDVLDADSEPEVTSTGCSRPQRSFSVPNLSSLLATSA